MIALDAAGGFVRDGRPIVPCGVNYWPASCGTDLLAAWPADEIRRDLDAVRGLGLNAVRFFLRWDHVEPELGAFDPRAFERLRLLLSWCAERDLLANPCLFVGFMSGGHFWPRGKGGRSMYADPGLVGRCAAQVAAAAAVCAAFPRHVLALDLGNEPSACADSRQAGPAAVAAWCATMRRAAQAACPGLPVMVGNDQNQVVGAYAWHFETQASLDLLSMHGYPVPTWHPIAFDGMADPLAQDLLPCYLACARAFGPVLLQEFGTILTNDPARQRAYLAGMLPAARAAGANGFLWWSLRDITARTHPYARGAFEGRLGLIDAADRPKPGVEPFLDFARALIAAPEPPPTTRGEVGIYWPRQWWARGDGVPDVGNRPEPCARRLLAAWHMLHALGVQPMIVRGDQPLDRAPSVLVNPGFATAIDETADLDAWVAAGGRLLWHGIDPITCGADLERLLGARPVDQRAARPDELTAFAGRFPVAAWPRGTALELDPGAGEVLARDRAGRPAAALSRRGAGRVLWAVPLIDEAVAADAADRSARAAWHGWYAGALAALRAG